MNRGKYCRCFPAARAQAGVRVSAGGELFAWQRLGGDTITSIACGAGVFREDSYSLLKESVGGGNSYHLAIDLSASQEPGR